MSRPSRELLQDAMGHIIKLVSAGQERGCYTLEEAVDIQKAITCFKEETSSTQSESEQGVLTLITAIEKCQSKGKLSLQEAYVAYQAITVISKSGSEK